MTNDDRKMFLVVGTGRSGTCWVGDILASHSGITGHVEPEPLFTWVTDVAVNVQKEPRLIQQIFREYERLWEDASPNHLGDKCHPSIWIAEKLAERFSNCYFVGVLRGVEATVASMLRHKGVRRWCEQWSSYPVPNRFLGISADNLGWYKQAGIIERCTVRWIAHQQELLRLQSVLGRRFFLLGYEDLLTASNDTLHKLQEFAGLTQAFADPSPRTDTLAKWQHQLTANDVERIQSTLHLHGVATAGSPCCSPET